jgi:dephospho-CoA kinase
MERDGFSREESVRRISAQMPLSEKVTYADFVIDNSGSRQETELQVKDVFKRLRMLKS